MSRNIKQEIFDLVGLFIEEKRKNKSWKPGQDWIQYSGPITDEKEISAAIDILLEEWLVFGEVSRDFEKVFSPLLGKKYGTLTSSGSSANLLMVSALRSKNLFNLPEQAKIITPVVCFPTTLNPILQNKLVPVFVDVELPSLNLDLEQVEKALKNDPDIKGIIFAHVLGNPPDMDRLMHLVEKYDLIFLEDACDALGSKYDGKLLGSFGHMSSCSFYPAHHMTMGEGGFVATDDSKARKVLASLREWGRECYCSSATPKNGPCESACGDRFRNWLPGASDIIYDHRYVYSEIGYNLKPTEMQAAFGMKQIDKLPELESARRENFKKMLNIFKPYSEYFYMPEAQEKSDPCWFAFMLTVREDAWFSKDDLVRHLEKNKIQTRTYFGGNILAHSAYIHLVPGAPENKERTLKTLYPVSMLATKSSFFLGVYAGIDDEKMAYIKTVVDNFFSAKRLKVLN